YRRIRRNMPQETLPTDPIGVDVTLERWGFVPILAIVDVEVLHHAEVLDRRGGGRQLHVAAVQAGDGGAVAAVDLQREEIVAPHPRRPRAQNGAEDAALDLDQRRRRILDRDRIALARFVDALRRRDPLA